MAEKVQLKKRNHFASKSAEEFRANNPDFYDEEGKVRGVRLVEDSPSVEQPSPEQLSTEQPSPEQPPVTIVPEFDLLKVGVNTPAPVVLENTVSEQEKKLQQKIDELNNQNRELTTSQQKILQQREEELAELEELRALRRKQEEDNLMSLNDIEFESIEPSVAQEVAQKIVRPIMDRQAKKHEDERHRIYKELEEAKEANQLIKQELLQREQMQLRERTNAAIYAAHPDFNDINNTGAFSAFLNSRVKGMQTTVGELVFEEYSRGNSDFVNSVVSQFKEGQPNIETIASAPVASTVAQRPAISDNPDYIDEMSKLVEARATGKISLERFRDEAAKIRARKNAPTI